MTVAVVALWNDVGCPHRTAAWNALRARYRSEHPDWPIVYGESHTEQYSRTQAILDGAAKTDADVLAIVDADVWSDGLTEAVSAVADGQFGWAVPHKFIHRLSGESTELVLAGADWRGLPLSTDNAQDRKPYIGHEAGTMLVIRRCVLERILPDPRFVGWGSEDDAWAAALNCLHGAPWRGLADCVHFWHPAQPRKNRAVGNDANYMLLRRYRKARRDRVQMAALVDEARVFV